MKNPVHLQHIGVTAVMGSEDFSRAVRPNCNLTARQHIPGGSDGTKWMDFIWRLNDKHNCNFSCGWKEIRDLRQGAAEKMVCRSDWWKILEVTPARLTSPDFFFLKPKSNIDKNPKLQLLRFGWIRANIVRKIEEKKDKTKKSQRMILHSSDIQCTSTKQAAGGSVVSLVWRSDISASILNTRRGEKTHQSGRNEKPSWTF